MKSVFLLAALALAACDGGASAVASRDHSSAEAARPVETAAVAPREPAPLVAGKPMWSSNSKYSARENAQYHFDRDGQTFGASTLDEFVQKAHAFTAAPPKGALTATRANGDKLVYDPASNTFAVATKDGAPRTMFKPDDGMAYWEKQKAGLNMQASRKPRDDQG